MSDVAIIPARGGSERIPRKNIRAFAGTPMIARSIRTAQDSGCFDAVVVSTDDQEIAEIARRYGAEVPFVRPARLADAHTGTTAVVQHAVRALVGAGADLELVCCLYATAPLLTPDLLREGRDALRRSGSSYAFSVARFTSSIQRALRLRSDGTVEPFWPDHVLTRSQDLESGFHDAGQFYWGTVEAWSEARPIHTSHSVAVVLPSERVQDIDTAEDWRRAEALFAVLQEGVG